MEEKEIFSHVDHTLLTQTATWEEIKTLCDEGIKYQTASVCIPPCFVKQAKKYVGDRLSICTVIGFPNGYQTTATKVFETKEAVANGADEIDVVINLGWVKEREWAKLDEEIVAVREACPDKILKAIIETCLLKQEEKIKMCEMVTKAEADYIKTSTGFSTAGATFQDIELFAKNVGPNVKIKAAGGISTLDDAKKFLSLGADRLGTSKIVKLIQEKEETISSY